MYVGRIQESTRQDAFGVIASALIVVKYHRDVFSPVLFSAMHAHMVLTHRLFFLRRRLSHYSFELSLFFCVLAAVGYAHPATAQKRIEYFGGDKVDLIEHRRARVAEGLTRLGLRDGRDFTLRARTFEGDKVRLEAMAAEIVRENPSIIFAASWDAANALKKYTQSIPIVFAARANLEAPTFRIVDNLLQPEANLTGFTRYVNLIPKKMQVLKQAFPKTQQVGFLLGVDIQPEREKEYLNAARKIGIELKFRRLEKADLVGLAEKLDLWDDAYLVAADDLLTYNRVQYIEQLAKTKKPVIHPEEATDKGVLMHYVPVMDGEAKAAEYISKLLRGAKIKDLAVQEPQEFDLSVNVTTLKRNGLTMSRDVLSRARKVE